MITMKVRGAWLLMMVGLASATVSCREGPRPAGGEADISEEITRVEQGLLPPILLKGRPAETMTLSDRMEHYGVPALSLAVLDRFEIVWARAYGKTAGDGTTPLSERTLFQAGSMSKPVAAVLALKLVAEGNFGLDTPVNSLLSSFHLPDNRDIDPAPVRVRHLLTHSAGLAPYVFMGIERGTPVPPLSALLAAENEEGAPAVRRTEPCGRRYVYSNPAYALLEQMLADQAGKPFPALAREKLFSPLGMEDSAFAPLPDAVHRDRAACGHGRDGAPVEGKGLIFPAAVGGLWTTPSDYCLLLRAMARSYAGLPDAYLPQGLARDMFRHQVEDEGLGLPLSGDGEALRCSHGGATIGFRAYGVLYPALGKGAVVMANADGGAALLHEVLRSVARAYEWPGYVEEYEVINLPPGTFARYEGTYNFDPPVGISMDIRGGEGKYYRGTYEMLPVSETRFVVPKSGDELEFEVGPSGPAGSFLYGKPGGTKIRARRAKREL